VRDLSGGIGMADVALALALVAIAAVISRVRRLQLENDIAVATVRSFAQLLAVGYALEFVFDGHGSLTVVGLALMIAVAAATAGRRARRMPGATLTALAAIATAAVGTLGVLLALQVIPTGPRAVLPLGSMVISNAMVTAGLVMTRLRDDLAAQRREVEARLCLGHPANEAARPWLRSALRTGMLPIIDNTKVVGLVALPGAMTGMILAGASPIAAIRLQLVVMYMLLGGNAFAALTAGQLAVRRLFTPSHQLVRALRR
jgi:putative ABC transport system permease protein